MSSRNAVVFAAALCTLMITGMRQTSASGQADGGAEQRIASLTRRVETLEKQIGQEWVNVDRSILARLSELERTVQELNRTLQLNRGGDRSIIDLRQFELTIRRLQQDVGQLDRRLNEIDTSVSSLRRDASGSNVRQLESEVRSLQSAVQRLESRLSRLESKS